MDMRVVAIDVYTIMVAGYGTALSVCVAVLWRRAD
jgi:hypothetical protein